MDFINTSQDIFYLVLAFCVLWFTILLTWLMYYAINAAKNIYDAVQAIKRKIEAVDEIIGLVKGKINSSFSYVSLAMSGVKKIIEILSEKNSDEKATKKRKR